MYVYFKMKYMYTHTCTCQLLVSHRHEILSEGYQNFQRQPKHTLSFKMSKVFQAHSKDIQRHFKHFLVPVPWRVSPKMTRAVTKFFCVESQTTRECTVIYMNFVSLGSSFITMYIYISTVAQNNVLVMLEKLVCRHTCKYTLDQSFQPLT